MSNVAEQVVAALDEVIPEECKPAYLHEPWFRGNEWKYVKDCIDSGWVSSVGSYVDKFEELLSSFTGAKYAIVTGNGTSALHTCLKMVGIGVDDEVLVPALTFVATANAVSHCEAIPHFVDCEEKSLGIDAKKLEVYLSETTQKTENGLKNLKTGRTIKALVVAHIFGLSPDMAALKKVAEDFGIVLLEDAAEGLGTFYKGRHAGNFGLLSALSFNGNKTITTGGGGAVITNDEALAKRAKHITTTARIRDKWEFTHDEIGYNYRLPNINAALGCAQMESLEMFLSYKRILAEKYYKVFSKIDSVRFMVEPENTRANYWLNAIVMQSPKIEDRNAVLDAAEKAGFVCRPIWKLMHLLPMYTECPRMDLSTAENMVGRVINIPSGPEIAAKIAGDL